jgi:hypothetical protein
MNNKFTRLHILVPALLLGVFSATANAFSVWAVESGDLSSSNIAGTPLVLSPGTNSIDLFLDTEGDISWGWDILLDITGTGSISGVTGGDINGGLGAAQADGGWRQLGGDFATDLNASSVLMFTFSFDASPGALLSIGAGSSYTSGSTFQSELITGGDLVMISAVPLPAAVWLFISGLAVLGIKLSRKSAYM